jgi:periplasmic protein CpxP/Spy
MNMNMTMLRKPILRTAILALCTTALGTLPVLAQDNSAPPAAQDQGGGGGRRGGPEMEARQLEMMTKQLNLTPDQVTQVKAIQDDTRKQSMAVRDDASVAGPDKRAKMMDIRKASQDKIRGVLTDDQKPKYDAMLAKMQERRGQRGQGGDAAPAPPPQ